MTIQTITAAELNEKLRRGEVVLIDVRESAEFASDHIPQALSIPLSVLDQHLASFADESRPLVFHCQSGMRSKTAAEKAAAALSGKTIYNFEGSFAGWQAANLPTTAGAAPSHGLPIERQVFLALGGLVLFCSLLALLGLKLGAVLTLLLGCGMLYAGWSGFCGMAFLLRQMPWNKRS